MAQSPGQTDLSHWRSQRLVKAAWTVAATYGARFTSLGVALVSIPLTLSYLDAERYGLWLIISSIIAYLNVTDLGLGLSLRNRVAEARGREQDDRVTGLLSTAFSTMVVVGSLVAVFGSALAWLLPLGDWFNVTSAGIELEWRATLTVVALTFAYSLPMKMIIHAQEGFQEAYVAKGWNVASAVASLVALLLVVWLKGNMVWLAFATFLLGQAFTLLNMLWFFRAHREVRLSLRAADRSYIRPLFGQGLQFLVIQLMTVVIWQTDNIVVGSVLGPEQVVRYAVAFRLVWQPLVLLRTVPSSLWPAYAEAKAHGDWQWVQQTFRRSTLTTVALASAAACVLFVWGRQFILLWAGPDAVGPSWLLGGLCIYLVAGHWTDCNAIMINAVGRPVQQVYSGSIDGALNLLLSVLLARTVGVAGVAWATVLANLAVSAWFLAWAVRRMTQDRVRPPVWLMLRVVMLPSAATVAAGVHIADWVDGFLTSGVAQLALGVPLTCCVFLVATLSVCPSAWRRWLVFELRRRLMGGGA